MTERAPVGSGAVSAARPLGRRTLLAVSASTVAALVAGCGPEGDPDLAPAVRPVRHHYGPGPQQYGDLYLPRGSPRGAVVVVHGGFWQSMYGLSLGAPTSSDLARHGWAAWNIEYRRLGDGGGWPHTFADVAAAVDHLARLDGVPTERVIGLGHSAGGHLAAWAASRPSGRRGGASLPGGRPRVRLAAVVPQAGVLDLATAARTGLGGTSIPGLVGGTPDRLPGRYLLADPVERLPLGVPIRCVHGTDDTTVPLSQSRSYVDTARAAGDDAELVEVPGDHFALIDPGTAAWRRTRAVLADLGRPAG